MKIVTKAFGEIEISEKQKITVKDGLLGFEDIHDFVLLDFDEGSPFYWLQAEKIPEIAFLIVDPKLIIEDYELDVDAHDLEKLEIKNDEDMINFAIVTLNDNPAKTSVNLLGPIVINKVTHQAKQLISLSDKYSVRHPLLSQKEA
ncbi:MAG: hypothetical protein A2015_07160 [Spirochaetes bacterium GWF1_31_7]|nr:MAG: hypothetical protein A2Y30_06660 [Spirochaetes bacterium GWE1_32_154]OHD52235.1 MAG: hypothetical protein A2Y29_07090 [Spirochaetes bacterium GWE2_31_10]OHD53035.1 MAG: hypothetical protein A2015_07160 [Spirochaetes bacterium GWF1_31_7]OHD80380.1 MAG: hypothetical protein A2355_05365 [Spirochaetes bacterium RIFOXYB1_FULL_32_8]HBD96177.1 flagellar assembly protein FliW [Spirochaetia bacterium]